MSPQETFCFRGSIPLNLYTGNLLLTVMKKGTTLLVASFILIITGFFLLAYSVFQGDSKIYLILIFPIITGGSGLGVLGILLLIGGIFLLPISLFYYKTRRYLGGYRDRSTRSGRKTGEKDSRNDGGWEIMSRGGRTRAGGVIFIGPIPIPFGSVKGIAKWMIVVGVIIAVIMLLMFVLQISRM